MKEPEPERFETIVVGAGQAGLSVGYHLARRGLPFVILTADSRIGDTWRNRWDSLRLFTPARFDGLDGMRFPASRHYFPTKDEMGDYLESYARHFSLPVHAGVRVNELTRREGRFLLTAGDRRYEAENVVVAMATFQKPKVPPFASELDPGIHQLHSSEYKRQSQLKPGGALFVGAGNSGAEIAIETVRNQHPTWMAGRDTGHIPFRIDGFAARLLLRTIFRVVFHRVLSVSTPIGRKVRPKALTTGGPLIRVQPKDMEAAGIIRVPRVAGVRNGLPLLEDGRVLEVTNVVWCTGFHPGFSWIKLPIQGEVEPRHQGGIVPSEPGLYFVGLHFLYALSSTMIHGVGRDAERIVKYLAGHRKPAQPGQPPVPRRVSASTLNARDQAPTPPRH